MEDIKTKAGLYRRIKPALYVRAKDIKKLHGISISPQEIFEYLETKIWKVKTSLTLAEMVEDIFYLDVDELFAYIELRRTNEEEK
ncbi:MAG: post-transcriptional regulator [Bacilli bacterium]|nr:post-transcriptional regulator [Bacilli bacterium]